MTEIRNSKMWRIWSMFIKELYLIRIDKFAMLLVFVLPTMVMGTMYVAINQGSPMSSDGNTGEDVIAMGVVDLDPTDTFPGEDLSYNFTLYLSRSPSFMVTIYDTEEDALDGLYRDTVDAYAVLPYGFEGNITGDIPALVPIHISSTNFDSQAKVFGAFSEVVTEFRADHGWVKGEIVMNNILEFKPTGNYMAATFGAFMLVFAVFIAVAATAAQAVVGDVPLSRMLLTPATKMESIVSKTLAYFCVGMLQSIFLIGLWSGLFGITPVAQDWWEFILWYLDIFLIMGLMSFAGSSLGVLISTLVTTRLQANQSFLFLLFGSLIVGTGFMDVGIVDDLYPLNIGRAMIIDVAFKGVALLSFMDQIVLVLQVSVGFILVAWIVFSRRRNLA
ncbi:MAG: ABC transporter permease [Candidatus Thorarchaeota archaeon]|nr:ABC transporter permease [Candidatus Thorarchaeota archaeon]